MSPSLPLSGTIWHKDQPAFRHWHLLHFVVASLRSAATQKQYREKSGTEAAPGDRRLKRKLLWELWRALVSLGRHAAKTGTNSGGVS